MRACAVSVDEVVGVSGFATPGMHVDVLISGTPPGEQNTTQGTASRGRCCRTSRFLSAGTDIQKDRGRQGEAGAGGQSAGHSGTGRDAEPGQQSVQIRLVLRNPLDTKIAPVPGTATSNLFADANAAPVKAAARRGSQRPSRPRRFRSR